MDLQILQQQTVLFHNIFFNLNWDFVLYLEGKEQDVSCPNS